VFLCANKADLSPDQWRVRKEEYETYARENNLSLYECSASSGVNVGAMFVDLGKHILLTNRHALTKVEPENGQTGNSIILAEFADRQKKDKKTSKSCCKS
jgi:hypothetical protein